MYLCLFEDAVVPHFEPLVHTRPIYDLRTGIRTIREAVVDAFDEPQLLLHCRPVLEAVLIESGALVNRIPAGLDVLFVNGRYLPEPGDLLARLKAAARPGEPGRVFMQQDTLVAAWMPAAEIRLSGRPALGPEAFDSLPVETVEGARLLNRLWDLVADTAGAIRRDYEALAGSRRFYERGSARVHPSAVLVEPERIYLAPGAVVQPLAVLNAENGPIYIGEEAIVAEAAVVGGPAFVGTHTRINSATVVHNCAFGPNCKIGGEVRDSIIQGFSNKAHDGFLGHSYLGAWCNLGADTNTSNLRNDYGNVSLYDPVTRRFESSGLMFLGLVMGDHSKAGINTMFNTGTVVGTSCNIFGGGFPPRHLPSFTWSAEHPSGYVEYRLDKALQVAEIVMSRRGIGMTRADRDLLTAIFEATREERTVA